MKIFKIHSPSMLVTVREINENIAFNVFLNLLNFMTLRKGKVQQNKKFESF